MKSVDEQRDEQFPAFRRLDAKLWHRCKFYPGAMFSMPARMLTLIVQGLTLSLICKILTLTHNFKKGPLKRGCRKSLVTFLFRINAKIYMFICGTSSSKEEI